MQASINAKKNTESIIRQEIIDDDRHTQEELKRIDAEIAEIQREKTEFIRNKEAKIEEAERKEDEARDLYHTVKDQMEMADDNVSF